MRKPKAEILSGKSKPQPKKQASNADSNTPRGPKAFAPETAVISPQTFEDAPPLTPLAEPQSPQRNWALRLALWAGGLLISLGLALMADRLIADLFARYEWLGWAGLALLGVFILTLLILTVREFLSLTSLKNLDAIRKKAQITLTSNIPQEGRDILARLQVLYAKRPELAKARQLLDRQSNDLFDGKDMVELAEYKLMEPLDARAKALTAASARRVAIVTAISPRALVDVAFVAYESLKLARAIASLYGARPGLFGALKLSGAILSHLAITGGVALGDSVIQQLLGHGLAAKLSARLGEGLVNGLMSVRVGIAAMGVTRPLPYDRLKQPQVMDFMADLANVTKGETTQN